MGLEEIHNRSYRICNNFYEKHNSSGKYAEKLIKNTEKYFHMTPESEKDQFQPRRVLKVMSRFDEALEYYNWWQNKAIRTPQWHLRNIRRIIEDMEES